MDQVLQVVQPLVIVTEVLRDQSCESGVGAVDPLPWVDALAYVLEVIRVNVV